MKRRFMTFGVALIALAGSFAFAGLRGPGKYSGVVIYDRWGACTLYSGIYVTYISEAVKEDLRKEAGKCVQIDATQVDQPKNPGDALIKAFKLLGPAPAGRDWESSKGIELSIRPTFQVGKPPEFVIRMENVSTESVTVHTGSFAPTLLANKERGGYRWDASDGPSSAVITRDGFWINESRVDGANETWHWKVTQPEEFQREFQIQPKANFEITISLKLPAGEYDFLAGYGGGVQESQCIASNLVAFDIDRDGVTHLVKVAGR